MQGRLQQARCACIITKLKRRAASLDQRAAPMRILLQRLGVELQSVCRVADALQPALTDAEARRLRGRAEGLAARHPLYPALG